MESAGDAQSTAAALVNTRADGEAAAAAAAEADTAPAAASSEAGAETGADAGAQAASPALSGYEAVDVEGAEGASAPAHSVPSLATASVAAPASTPAENRSENAADPAVTANAASAGSHLTPSAESDPAAANAAAAAAAGPPANTVDGDMAVDPQSTNASKVEDVTGELGTSGDMDTTPDVAPTPAATTGDAAAAATTAAAADGNGPLSDASASSKPVDASAPTDGSATNPDGAAGDAPPAAPKLVTIVDEFGREVTVDESTLKKRSRSRSRSRPRKRSRSPDRRSRSPRRPRKEVSRATRVSTRHGRTLPPTCHAHTPPTCTPDAHAVRASSRAISAAARAEGQEGAVDEAASTSRLRASEPASLFSRQRTPHPLTHCTAAPAVPRRAAAHRPARARTRGSVSAASSSPHRPPSASRSLPLRRYALTSWQGVRRVAFGRLPSRRRQSGGALHYERHRWPRHR
jgi:hypothetical protein